MKNLTWQNPEQLFVAQELINKVKSKCCGIKDKKNFSQVQEHIEKAKALLAPHVDPVFWLNVQLMQLQYFSQTHPVGRGRLPGPQLARDGRRTFP